MLAVAPVLAQDDPNDTPLGDVARNLRKKNPPAQQVIDDDNLSKVMDQAESRRTEGSGLRFLMAGESKVFQVSAPDATCSLSFSAGAKALLSNQYAQMELPPTEVVKLEGPATIEGDALSVSVFNGTQWHVSEVAVALTIVNKTADASLTTDSLKIAPAGSHSPLADSEVRPEKKPDVTVIYRMRAAAPPWSTTVFSAPLNPEVAPGAEWHWAIVQARGYPPQDYSSTAQTTAKTIQPAAAERVPPPAPLPQNSPVASLPQSPQ